MKLNNFFILFFSFFFITTNSIAYSQIKIETIEYPNGDVYKGEVKDGKPHGVGEWFGSLYTPDGASKYTCDKFIEYVAQNLTSIQAIENFVKLETNFHDVVWDQNYALGEKSYISKQLF